MFHSSHATAPRGVGLGLLELAPEQAGPRSEHLGSGEREQRAVNMAFRERRVEQVDHVAIGVHDHERGDRQRSAAVVLLDEHAV